MAIQAPVRSKQDFFSKIESAGSFPSFPYAIAVAAVVIAATCSLLVYPEVAGLLNNKVTTDRYDELGLGLYHNGTISFYPDPQPTVLRAPLYPALLAAVFALGEQYLPLSIQIVQALLHGLTCLLTFRIAEKLGGSRRAVWAALLCAVFPYLVWYTGRMVIETVSILSFTLVVFCVLHLSSKPTRLRAVAAGFVIGAAVLCKSTYLPFVLMVPFLLVLSRPKSVRFVHVALVLVVSLATMLPWIVRNYEVSGRWGIVQALTGYNFYVGDAFVERYAGSPLSYASIIARTDFTRMDEGLPESISRTTGARREALQDQWLLWRSLQRYAKDPLFLLGKIAANAVMFWTLGSTPAVSVFTMVLQIPLLFFFVRAAAKQAKEHGLWASQLIPVWLIAIYFAIHLPVYALARFGIVFVPTMLAYASSLSLATDDHGGKSEW